ncbi:MAG: sulfide-dependent adenosine diphosphate thiazole synthase [Thermofilaceae archaeon]|nr:sulfide-dependent adenosine diphosphate thiazole synthase [Thermofilaceae archaeon]
MSTLESRITKAIWKATAEDWLEFSEVDVIVVGAGPAGLTAGKYLAGDGLKTLVLERRLSFGGGIGGGGMMLHKVAVGSGALHILDEFGIRRKYLPEFDLYVVDAAELMAKLAARALDSGAKILTGVSVEDLIVREQPFRVEGVVVQWSAVQLASLHVDPIFIQSKAVVDATGHDAEVLKVLERKNPRAGVRVAGESSAWAEAGEIAVVEKAGKVVEGLYTTGMAVASLYQAYRMGPIFSGMLLSGKRVAQEIRRDLKGK